MSLSPRFRRALVQGAPMPQGPRRQRPRCLWVVTGQEGDFLLQTFPLRDAAGKEAALAKAQATDPNYAHYYDGVRLQCPRVAAGARGFRARAKRYAARVLPQPVRVWDGERACSPWLQTAPAAARALSFWWGLNFNLPLQRLDGTVLQPGAPEMPMESYAWPREIDGVPTGAAR